MVIWTVMPDEFIFSDFQPDCAPEREEVKYQGVSLIVERISTRQCRIERLLTTNPADYLRPELQPGVVLTYYPTNEALSF